MITSPATLLIPSRTQCSAAEIQIVLMGVFLAEPNACRRSARQPVKMAAGIIWIVSMEGRVMQMVRRLFAYAGMLIFGLVPRAALAQDPAKLPYMNPELSPDERATDLVHRMTLAEKASQMQNNSAAVPRLYIPAYQWWSEALHGVINEGVTEYPEPIGLAATFDAAGNSHHGRADWN